MSGFTKLFSTLVTSTVWREDDKTRVVWITMLALADRNGYVAASVPGLAAMANVATEDCRMALERLKAADHDSRTQEHQGRRIEDVGGGWNLLNYSKYRELGRSVDRTEYLRIKQQESRSRRGRQPMSTNVNRDQPISEAEAEAEAEDRDQKKTGSESECIAMADIAPPFLVFACNGAKREFALTEAQASRWAELFPAVDVKSECRAALAWLEADPKRRKTAAGMLRFLSSWLGRSQNRGGNGAARSIGGKTSGNVDIAKEFLRGKGLL